MWKVLMPRKIAFGENAAKEFQYPKNSLVITTTTPDIYNKWLDYMGIKNYEVYDKVTPDPAIESIEAIKKQYEGKEIGAYIGLGGVKFIPLTKIFLPFTMNCQLSNLSPVLGPVPATLSIVRIP